MYFNLDNRHEEVSVHTPQPEWVEKIVWDRNKVDIFVAALNYSPSLVKLNKAKNCIGSDLGTSLKLLVDCLQDASSCMIKRYKTGGQRTTQKWFDKDCFASRKKARILLRKCKLSKKKEDRLHYVEARNTYSALVRKKKQTFQKDKVQILTNNLNNPAVFWRELRACGTLMKRKTIRNSISITEWREHFMKVFETGKEPTRTFTEHIDDQMPNVEELDKPITKQEVVGSIKRLKSGKSGGLDGIVPEMLKEASNQIGDFLTDLFNEIFISGVYPDSWTEAIVVPVHKKGDANMTDNYRGISLLNLLGKCYTTILNKRLYSWLECNDKIIESQAGFRKGYSTTDHVFTLYAITQKYLSKKGGKLYVAFIDLKKAFDSVSKATLIESLYRAGISERFLNAVKTMYHRVVACVRSNCEVSDKFDCPKGLRQGCTLSTTLFAVIINQVAVRVNESGRHGIQLTPGLIELLILLFADDIALLSCTPTGLQTQLDLLCLTCKELDLNINTDKSKAMVFRHGGYLSKHEKWYVDGVRLEVVNKYVYLGYTFTTTMSFIEAANSLATKGRKATYDVVRAHNQLQQMTTKTFFRIFDSMVQPVLTYSSEIWGLLIDPEKDATEKIHMLACKRFLNVSPRTPNKMVYGELGRHPLHIIHCVKAIKYWLRLLKMDEKRLPKQAYRMLVSMDANGKTNWVTNLRGIICKAGFGHVWYNEGVGNENSFCKAFRQRLVDMYMQEWQDALFSSDRFSLYRSIKVKFGAESYLDSVRQKCFRDALIRIRLGISNLRSHKNRYMIAQTVNDMCPFCTDARDDELHMMFICPAYDSFRPLFMRNAQPDRQATQLVTLLKSSEESKIRQIAWFLFKSLQKHDIFTSE